MRLLRVLSDQNSITGLGSLLSMSERDYVQKSKLVVLVESKESQTALFKSMLEETGYTGSLRTFKRIDSAVNFLNKTVSDKGLLVAADLLFFSFDITKHNIMQVLNRFSAEVSDIDKEEQHLPNGRTFLKQNVVLLLDWNAIVIKACIREGQIVGYLTRPI